MSLILYADGGLLPDPTGTTGATGGHGLVAVRNGGIVLWEHACHGAPSTNQTAELRAAMAALRAAKVMVLPGEEAIVRSDSAYVVNCFNQGWWFKWFDNGWLNSSKEPVANADLWREILGLWAGTHAQFFRRYGRNMWNGVRDERDREVLRRSLEHGARVVFEKVKGHSGEEFNEEADRLAGLGARLRDGECHRSSEDLEVLAALP